ncbi:MAG TPA: PEP-CTERM sorting domain-containing protein [Tepidisphaeraceae bacterium]|jgi:hypothetical protein|nr:PEP-CTERM sorting domain-containing protein [Tepidisphaeraceae bacterium]
MPGFRSRSIFTLFMSFAAAAVAGSAATARSASIGIQFQGSQAALAPTDSAGVVPQTNWNAEATSSFTNVALNDNSGNATTAVFSGSADGTYFGGNGFTPGTGDATLTAGELYQGMSSTVGSAGLANNFTITNIPYPTYDVYVYGDADAGGRVISDALTPSGGSTTFISFTTENGSNGWVAGTGTWNGIGTPPADPSANYAHFAGITASGFVLQSGAQGNGGINGIEIVATPEPASLGLLGVAALGLLARRRRTA